MYPSGLNYRIIIAISILLITASIVFMPCLDNNFVWDDEAYVLKNNFIQNFSSSTIRQIFSSFYIGNYHPLTIISFVPEYHFFNLNPSVYHATNMIIHLCNCVLVFWMIYLLSNSILVALIVSLLFSIHPLRVESVVWISGRKDVLYALFFLGSIISYFYYINKKTLRFYYISILLFLFSLLSKAMAVPLPFVLILLDYLVQKRFKWRMVKDKIPFFILSIMFGIIAIFSQQDGVRQDYFYSLLRNFLVACHGLIFYLEKMVFPLNLSCLYQYPIKIKEGYLIKFLLSPFIVATLAVLVFYSKKYTKKIIFGSLFYLFTVLPVLQLLPVGQAIAADRYTYIPLVGIFFILGEAISWVYRKKLRATVSLFKMLFILIIAGAILILSLLTWNRCLVWRDSVTLWNDVLKNQPDNYVAYNNRGAAYFLQKDYVKAINDFQSAIQYNPIYDQPHANLCHTYSVIGQSDKALPYCKKAMGLNPRMADVYNDLGNIYWSMDKNAAISMYLKSVALEPHNESAFYNLCTTYLVLGKIDEATNACHKAIEISPNFIEAYDKLGNIYITIGKLKEAIELYKKLLEINPELASAHNNLGVAYYYTKQYDLSVKHINRAIELGYKVNPEFLELLRPYQERNQ